MLFTTTQQLNPPATPIEAPCPTAVSTAGCSSLAVARLAGGPAGRKPPKRKKSVKRKKEKKKKEKRKKKDGAWGVVVAVGDAYFLALLFDPLSHLAASAASLSASAAAAFCAAASALRAWPWAFLLVFSDPPFFAMSIA